MATSPSQSTPQPTLPEALSPDQIDMLPVLSAILSRLQTLSPASTSGSPSEASPSQVTSGTGPLSIKDIPAATDELKHRLQKARAQVKELPDIERGMKEQEEEIRVLEERIKRQREVLEGLKRKGVEARAERDGGGQVMEGVES